LLTEKFAVVTLYSYFPALFDHTINIAWELVSNVNASVTMDLSFQVFLPFGPPAVLRLEVAEV